MSKSLEFLIDQTLESFWQCIITLTCNPIYTAQSKHLLHTVQLSLTHLQQWVSNTLYVYFTKQSVTPHLTPCRATLSYNFALCNNIFTSLCNRTAFCNKLIQRNM